MFVASLWRYPVKSLQGEMVARVDLVESGIVGDRSFGILDLASGAIASAKRYGELLQASAYLSSDGVAVRVPGGSELGPGAELDERLSEWRGRPSRLVSFDEFGVATFESQNDFEDDDSSHHSWTGPEGSFTDSRPVHLLGTGELGAAASERPDLQWDVRRFRPNILIEDRHGDGSLTALAPGTIVELGQARLRVDKPCQRCVMPTRPQPGGLERQLDVLRHLHAVRGNDLGLLATVERAGTIGVGDEVRAIA